MEQEDGTDPPQRRLQLPWHSLHWFLLLLAFQIFPPIFFSFSFILERVLCKSEIANEEGHPQIFTRADKQWKTQ